MSQTELISLGKSYTYRDCIRDTAHLTARYPGVIRYFRIGMSLDNREIGMFRVGNGTHRILCSAGVHGRESTNTPVMMKMVEMYAWMAKEHSWLDYQRMDRYFQRNSFYFIPLLNPDGYEVARAGAEIIKNPALRQLCGSQEVPAEEWKLNGRGVDINRNFPARSYRRRKPSDCPASEPETQALIRVMLRTDFTGFMDFHCRGKEIYYYRSEMDREYNDCQLKYARALQQVCGYDLKQPEEELEDQVYGGNTVHYFSEHLGGSAVTIETVEDEEGFPLNPKLQIETLEEVWYLPFQYANLLSDT